MYDFFLWRTSLKVEYYLKYIAWSVCVCVCVRVPHWAVLSTEQVLWRVWVKRYVYCGPGCSEHIYCLPAHLGCALNMQADNKHIYCTLHYTCSLHNNDQQETQGHTLHATNFKQYSTFEVILHQKIFISICFTYF
jgi:hypothetical protein